MKGLRVNPDLKGLPASSPRSPKRALLPPPSAPACGVRGLAGWI